MKNKYKRRTAVAVILTLLACTVAVSFAAGAETAPEFTAANEIPAAVVRSGEITPPTVTATLDGVTRDASVSVYDPSGRLVSTGESFYPAATGTYTIKYKANFGVTYTETHTFTVTAAPSGMFSGDAGIEIATAATSGDMYATEFGGIKITASSDGATAYFNQPIDLSYNTKSDPLISLLILPSAKGTLDFDQFTVTLTDVHDPDNVLRIVNYRGSWGYHTSYVRAAANKQTLSGFENDILLTSANAGSPIWFSYTAENQAGQDTGDRVLCTYMYDDAEKSVYISNPKRTTYTSRPGLVTDLDSLECQDEKLLWEGFTTGEVYLSITFEQMLSNSAVMLVTSVNGIDLSGETTADETAPVIMVDDGGYAAAPAGLAGHAYPVFPATAYDKIDGALTPYVTVYRDYGGVGQTLTDTRVTGSFVPETAGDYTIVYTARDSSGNYAEYTVPVTVYDALDPLTVTYEFELQAAAFVGERIRLPEATVSGGSGNNTAETYVVLPDGSRSDDRYLTPETEGTYTLRTVASDYLGQTVTAERTIKVTVSDAPIIGEANVRPVYLSGYTYDTPRPAAYDYKAGASADVTVTVRYGDGAGQTLADTFTPDIAQGDTVTFEFTARGASGQPATRTETAYIVDVGTARARIAENYFYHAGFDAFPRDNYVEYVSTGEDSLYFANPVLADGLELNLFVGADYNEYEALRITLTDSEDSAVSLDIRIERGTNTAASSSVLRIGDDPTAYTVASSFFGITSYGFLIGYSDTNQTLTDLNANTIIGKTEYGDFAGFPSGKVYITLALEGIYGSAGVRVKGVGNQDFSCPNRAGEGEAENRTIMDRTAPEIVLTRSLRLTTGYGEPCSLPAALTADVLSPFAELTLSVTAPDGTVLYNGPIDEDYTFTPEQYGTYRISYSATDGTREESTSKNLIVKDRTPPVITLSGSVPATAGVGDAIKLPQASVSDNNDTDLACYIMVTDPRGRMFILSDGDRYEYAGVYTVTYYSYDTYYAYTTLTYTVTVA